MVLHPPPRPRDRVGDLVRTLHVAFCVGLIYLAIAITTHWIGAAVIAFILCLPALMVAAIQLGDLINQKDNS